MDNEALKALLIKHESIRLFPYKDSVGKLTIGVGRCLDTNGISKAEALAMLDNDVARVVAECRAAFSWFDFIGEARQHVIASMAFNLGIGGLKEFVKMLAAVARGDYEAAANEMKLSKWAAQVKDRAVELAAMMRDGDVIH